MKKWAMIIMGDAFDENKDRAVFCTPGMETHVLTVKNPEEAAALARRLSEEGFGAIEVCGAFGEELARSMYEASGKKLSVGYVVTPDDQKAINEAFWSH